ncbi:hypothetical protein X975_17409, partial [Stegodyphus mimosarum]
MCQISTWFEGSCLNFFAAVKFTYCWYNKLTSAESCNTQLKINHDTVTNWKEEVCTHACYVDEIKINGNKRTVDVDESLFTRKCNAGYVPFAQ